MTSDLSQIEGLGFFLYRSAASDGVGAVDLQTILGTARARNESLSLTGCLHHEDGLFFQWLEGPAAALREVVASIMGDPRHTQITVLGQGALAGRRFQDWRMRFSDRDEASLMDWFARGDASTVDRNDYADGVVTFLMGV